MSRLEDRLINEVAQRHHGLGSTKYCKLDDVLKIVREEQKDYILVTYDWKEVEDEDIKNFAESLMLDFPDKTIIMLANQNSLNMMSKKDLLEYKDQINEKIDNLLKL